MDLSLRNWATSENVWDDLCQKGKLYTIDQVIKGTGMSKTELLNELKCGMKIKNSKNRIQNLCIIPPKYIGSDSEATTKKCLAIWFEKNNYKTYGADSLEVPFSTIGLQALSRLAKSLDNKDFESLRRHLQRNGIDLIAFSQEESEVILVEVKGWTETSSDFNEAIHKILRRIESLQYQNLLRDSIKFACAFPDFHNVRKWERKYQNLYRIKTSPSSLYNFSSATNVRCADGENFLIKFVEGLTTIQNLIKSDRRARAVFPPLGTAAASSKVILTGIIASTPSSDRHL